MGLGLVDKGEQAPMNAYSPLAITFYPDNCAIVPFVSAAYLGARSLCSRAEGKLSAS